MGKLVMSVTLSYANMLLDDPITKLMEEKITNESMLHAFYKNNSFVIFRMAI